MATFSREIISISRFIRWHERDQLILQPKFQRRSSWENAARSYLIDTVVRELSMPKVYLRKIVDPKKKQSAYEVVDGQQRLRAILDFFAGTLVLSKRHNPDLGDTTFDRLPDAVRRRFLAYEISTDIMEKATDPEVWALFERLNSYTLTLNRQERLNAKHFGYFKQTAYILAAEQSALEAWESLKVFGDRQIARMKEVELTSDVLLAIIEGISDITDIAAAYRRYDDDFPQGKEASQRFREALSYIVENLAEAVRVTRFRRRAWFYSLLVSVADAMRGIPDGNGPASIRNATVVRRRMSELDAALRVAELLSPLAELLASLSRATSHVPQRRVRHNSFFAMLTQPDAPWDKAYNRG